VALAVVYLFALRECGFTGGVVKVSLGYVVLALAYLFALRVCGFTGGVKGKSRVCGSSTCVFVCPADMWFTGGVMVSLES
jgi:hypothetical protein